MKKTPPRGDQAIRKSKRKSETTSAGREKPRRSAGVPGRPASQQGPRSQYQQDVEESRRLRRQEAVSGPRVIMLGRIFMRVRDTQSYTEASYADFAAWLWDVHQLKP